MQLHMQFARLHLSTRGGAVTGGVQNGILTCLRPHAILAIAAYAVYVFPDHGVGESDTAAMEGLYVARPIQVQAAVPGT